LVSLLVQLMIVTVCLLPQASKFQDPVTGQDVIMFIQTDASARVRAEELLGHVLDAEHALLEEVFPRQVRHLVSPRTHPGATWGAV
jgi:hypothetical protein